MKVAIVHDNLMQYGGAERVLEELISIYPEADIYTVTYNPARFRHSPIARQQILPSYLNHFPGKNRIYKWLFCLYPAAVESFNLSAYDLVISSSYNVAHGVITRPGATHICYYHTPSRWLWHQSHNTTALSSNLGRKLPGATLFSQLVFHGMRQWDYQAAQRPDIVIANSQEVQKRIAKYYHREATVIYPPVEVDTLKPDKSIIKEDYYLTLSRLVPYKHIDLIIKAFQLMPERELRVAGEGPERNRLEKLAHGYRNIQILGYVSEQRKIDLLQKARAFVFAPYEDFGIMPVQALAAGTPVIAYGKGGVLESVQDGKTGILFQEQSSQEIQAAVKQFEKRSFSTSDMVNQAEQFSAATFKARWQKAVG